MSRQDPSFLIVLSQLRPFAKCKHITTTFDAPHSPALADLLFRHAAQCTQRAFVGVVRQEAMVIRCQTTNDVPTIGLAVSGVFDSVGLVLSVKYSNTACTIGVKFERRKPRIELTSMIASPFASSSIVGAGSFGRFADSGLADG